MRNKMKTLMTGSISHELRTPLNGLIIFIQHAIKYKNTDEKLIKEYLDPSLDCANHLLNLVNDILTFTQL